MIKSIHDNCFCGAPLVLRKNRTKGNYFLGCSTFPECRQTFEVSDKDVQNINNPVKRSPVKKNPDGTYDDLPF